MGGGAGDSPWRGRAEARCKRGRAQGPRYARPPALPRTDPSTSKYAKAAWRGSAPTLLPPPGAAEAGREEAREPPGPPGRQRPTARAPARRAAEVTRTLAPAERRREGRGGAAGRVATAHRARLAAAAASCAHALPSQRPAHPQPASAPPAPPPARPVSAAAALRSTAVGGSAAASHSEASSAPSPSRSALRGGRGGTRGRYEREGRTRGHVGSGAQGGGGGHARPREACRDARTAAATGAVVGI